MGCDFKIAIEEQEFEEYNKYIPKEQLITIPDEYFHNYDTCDDYGTQSDLPSGACPVRNFIWEHSIEEGYERHWQMDDNINGFYRLNQNREFRVKSPVFFRWMEDFVDQYTNIGLAGPNYETFVHRKRDDYKPVRWNTRIYSCTLILNRIPYRWECRFNDDTDLSIRVLKGGWCTTLFNTFLQEKKTTQSVKGGLKETYQKYGTKVKSSMLVNRHPDVCRLVWRFNRWHHYCDYKPFKNNKPIKKPQEYLQTQEKAPELPLIKNKQKQTP
jgi:hypothetical protein